MGRQKLAPKTKRPTKPKLTNAERHKRFVAMAHEVEADERPEGFDKAFQRVVVGGSNHPSKTGSSR